MNELRPKFARGWKRLSRIGGILVFSLAAATPGNGAAFADYTFAMGTGIVDLDCGVNCPTSQVEATFVWMPESCIPNCTVYPGVGSSGLCSSIESVELHIPDAGDDCIDVDGESPFPVDLLAGPFVLTNAQLQGLLGGDYMLRATLSDFCEGVNGDCVTSGDCPGGEPCLEPSKPKVPVTKGTPPPPPPIAKPIKMHFPQLPDEEGWDVMATDPQILADDWLCTETGLVSGIYFWGSWLDDIKGNIVAFDLRIYSDVPAPPFSQPGGLLWQWVAPAGSWVETPIVPGPWEGWYDPAIPLVLPANHPTYYRYDFNPVPKPFLQFEGNVYWLAITAIVDGPEQWGWKSTLNHWNDAAVWAPVAGGPWTPMFQPGGRKQRLDLAFLITHGLWPIPTLSEWAVVALTLLLLVSGTIVFGRSRRRARVA